MAGVGIARGELLRTPRDDTEVDAFPEGLVLLVELMEAKGKAKTPARAVRTARGPHDMPQRVLPEAVGHPGGLLDAPAPRAPAREPLVGAA